jgi:hypothetical protein
MGLWDRIGRWFGTAPRADEARARADAVAAELKQWNIVRVDNPALGTAVIRIRLERPTLPNLAEYKTLVKIAWPYADDGLPPSELADAMQSFESVIEPLTCENGFAYLCMVAMGQGKKEWFFYTTDRVRFTRTMTSLFGGRARFPIRTTSEPDPEWQQWRDVVDATLAKSSSEPNPPEKN